MRTLAPIAIGAMLLASCALQDANTPVPQPDSVLFGRVAGVQEVEGSPGVWEVDVKAGLPESLQAVMRREGRTIPEMEKDLAARVRVTADSVCIVDSLPAEIDAFRTGQEVGVVPVPGSSTLTGTKLLRLEAAELYRFSSYEARFLPRALNTLPTGLVDRNDPARINSSGTERTPIPIAGGKVIYFAAGLLPPASPGEGAAPRGAVRAGMRDGKGAFLPWVKGGLRPFRVAWGNKGWEVPTPVELPGLPPEASARITWANEKETECLVEVVRPNKPLELMASTRKDAREAWGPLEKVKEAIGTNVGDGQRFGRAGAALVWTVYDGEASNLWLAMPGKDGQALEPRINTMGPEWAPRVGPDTTLYFCRAERQLLFAGGAVQEVRLAGKQRQPLLEAVPTPDGSLLFFRVPRYTPGDLDWDLAVAPREGKGWGPAVRLDDWKAM